MPVSQVMDVGAYKPGRIEGATARTRFRPRWAGERRRTWQASSLPQRRAQAHRFQPM